MPIVDSFPLRSAMEARDVEAVAECFAEDAVLYSPFTPSVQFRGRDQIALIASVIFECCPDLEYTDAVYSEGSAVLVSRAHVHGRKEIEFSNLLRLDPQGLVREDVVFARPLPAVAAALRAFGATLGRRKSAARGALISTLAGPLAFMAGTGDRAGVALLKPTIDAASSPST